MSHYSLYFILLLETVLIFESSSPAKSAFRNFFLRDIPFYGMTPNDLFKFRASPYASAGSIVPAVKYENVKQENNDTANKSRPGYGDTWVYALHNNEGEAERLDLSSDIVYEPHQLLENRSLDFMAIQLFTRKNQDKPENLTVDPYFQKPFLRSKFFNPNKRTKVLAHGWSPESIGLEEFKKLISVYLKLGNFNVIFVSWSAVSSEEYILPVVLFPYVSRRVSAVLKTLVDTYKYEQDIHLIGHGVGAHILGYAAELSTLKIARITGLDPERPFFEKPKSNLHMLDKNDAKFVDIIHTCKGIRGYTKSHGHVDFFPNGGESPQPGCTGFPVLKETCSHFRALYYYMESLSTKIHFYAYPCKNFLKGECDEGFTLMGEFVFRKSRGLFYLETNKTEPFAIGKRVDNNIINVNISDSNPPGECANEEDDDDDKISIENSSEGSTPSKDVTPMVGLIFSINLSHVTTQLADVLPGFTEQNN